VPAPLIPLAVSQSSPDSPVRILHVEGNADGSVGGSHRALVNLALGMDRRRFEPVVLFYQDNKHVAELRARGVQVLCYEKVRERELRIRLGDSKAHKFADMGAAILRRRAFLREHRIGLLHLNNSPLFGFSDWLPAARLARIPCITFAMGDASITRPVNRWFAKRFDHVIACSRYMAEAMRNVGVRDERLSWTYLGIDPASLRAAVRRSPAETRREFGVPDDEVLIVMIGNLRSWKGQHVLLESLRGMGHEMRRKVHVLFVGAITAADAAYEAELRRMIAELDGVERLRIIGARDDVPTLLAAADIAVHASTMAEPFGLVVPEAMVQGAAVVASRFGGPGEVIDSECGLTFDPGRPAELTAHLSSLIANPERRRRMGAAARGRAEQRDLSIEAMVERVQAVYARVLQ